MHSVGSLLNLLGHFRTTVHYPKAHRVSDLPPVTRIPVGNSRFRTTVSPRQAKSRPTIAAATNNADAVGASIRLSIEHPVGDGWLLKEKLMACLLLFPIV